MKKGPLVTKSFQFALDIVQLYKYLKDDRREYVLSKQILRAGTSVGANIRESQNAESKADFVHKLAIAQKECDETMFWLELLLESEYITKEKFEPLYSNSNEILKMLRSSILTIKNKL